MGTPLPDNGTSSISTPFEGTVFDKAAPTGPPTPKLREVPSHLAKIVRFFQGIVADEGLLLDLCLDRAVGIVEFNYQKRLAGADFFAQEQPTALHFVGMAGPLAVELYKQTLESIKGRQDEYEALLREATDGARPSPVIHAP